VALIRKNLSDRSRGSRPGNRRSYRRRRRNGKYVYITERVVRMSRYVMPAAKHFILRLKSNVIPAKFVVLEPQPLIFAHPHLTTRFRQAGQTNVDEKAGNEKPYGKC
jgi:hypothetical protein